MDDLISRQAAIEELAEQIALCDKALNSFGISMKDEYAVKVERASLVAYREQLEAIPAANVAPVVRCKDCRYHVAIDKCCHPDGLLCAKDNDFCGYGERESEHER